MSCQHRKTRQTGSARGVKPLTAATVKWIAKKGGAIPLTHHSNEQFTWITEGLVEVYSQGRRYVGGGQPGGAASFPGCVTATTRVVINSIAAPTRSPRLVPLVNASRTPVTSCARAPAPGTPLA